LLKKDIQNLLITKGAYSHVIEICSYAENDGKVVNIKEVIQKIKKLYTYYSGQGFKLIAVAYKQADKDKVDFRDENEGIFLGFVILHDPLKKDAKDLIDRLLSLGIKLRIITGDNKFVAQHIAENLGLKGKGVK